MKSKVFFSRPAENIKHETIRSVRVHVKFILFDPKKSQRMEIKREAKKDVEGNIRQRFTKRLLLSIEKRVKKLKSKPKKSLTVRISFAVFGFHFKSSTVLYE